MQSVRIPRRRSSLARRLTPVTSTAAAKRAFCKIPWRIKEAILRGDKVCGKRWRTMPREFPLFVPAAQAVEFVAPDFHVHALHRNKVWQGSDFILRRENNVRVSDR